MSEPFYKKPVAGLLLLAGATGGPYLLFETEAGQQASQGATQILGGTFTNETPAADAGHFTSWESTLNDTSGSGLNPALEDRSLQQPVIESLKEVLRFDIRPDWVWQRFPRVSTVLAHTQLDGLRVPLVTGTAPSDVAGTLTYYFDRYHRLQRVTVHGVTGDANRFLAELQTLYQLKQEPALGGALYLVRWNARPTSVAYFEPAAVIYADAPYSRFNVFIELNQAGLEYGLSQEAQHLIDAGKSNYRW
jgi:hypothetical protein